MNRILRISERARADVEQIFLWLVRQSPQGAISWYIAHGRAVERIAEAGESYGAAPEAVALNRDWRQILFKTRRGRIYRIVFELTETEAVIHRVRGPGQAMLRRRDLPDF